MRKIIAIILVVLMMVAIFAGCQGDNGNNNQNEKNNNSNQVTNNDENAKENDKNGEKENSSDADKAENEVENETDNEADNEHDMSEVITISIATIADAPPKEDNFIFKQALEDYNINFEYITIDRSKYNEVLGLKISTGEIPDVFTLDGNMLQYAKFQKQGVISEIPLDLLKKYAPIKYDDQEKYFKYLLIEEKLYGLTGEKPSNEYPLNALWNKTWLDNVGIDKVPTTIEEAETAFYAFANDDPDQNGKNDTYALGKSGLDMIFGAYGGIPWGPWPQYWLWLEQEDGGLQNAAVLPGMKDALAKLQQWYADGVLDPEFVLGENKGGYWAISTDFFNQKIGFSGLGHFYHWAPVDMYEGYEGGRVMKEFVKQNPDTEIAYGKPVVGPNGDSGTWQYPVGVGAAGMTVFGAQVDENKMTRMLIALEDMASDIDTYIFYRFGNEGEHWYRDDKSKAIIRTEAYSENVKFQSEGISILSFNAGSGFQKQLDPKLYEWADSTYNFDGYLNKLLVSLPSESKVRSELEKLRDQYYTEIISGDRDVDDFDRFVTEWNKLGGETLKQEADEWYKN